MIGLDTNVVARYLFPKQYALANRLLESLSKENPGFIPVVCMVELVWVMRGARRTRSQQILTVLETILRSDSLVVEQAELVWRALRQFARSNADFADCLIERVAHTAGCDQTATFDRKAVSVGMKLLV